MNYKELKGICLDLVTRLKDGPKHNRDTKSYKAFHQHNKALLWYALQYLEPRDREPFEREIVQLWGREVALGLNEEVIQ